MDHGRFSIKLAFFAVLVISCTHLPAQVRDDFSDGNLTNDPTWKGDTSAFRINQDQRLQLDAPSNSSPAVIYTSGNFKADTLEWRLWQKLDFSPSDQNQSRIYLALDTVPTASKAQGYYLQIGENGQADGIDLFRKDSNQAQKIIDGKAGFALKGLLPKRIRVRYYPDGTWQIAADSNGRKDWLPQGQVVDTAHQEFRYLGLEARFTSTRADRFYFDDVYQGPFAPDTTPPKLQDLVLKDSQTLQLVFSEPLTPNAATQVSLSPGNRQLSAVGPPAQRPSLLTLRISPPLKNKNKYKLAFNSLADDAGNTLTDTVSFTYVVPAKGDVVMTELMPDPTPSRGLPAVEYVEVYNKLSFSVDLEGWQVTDPANAGRIEQAEMLPAKEYAVLAGPGAAADLEKAGVKRVVPVDNMPTLNNGGEVISLIGNRGDTLDRVDYTPAWYKVDSLSNGGYSLALINLFSPCKGSVNWQGSRVDSGGTPGQPNSVLKRFRDTIPPEPQSLRVLDSNQLLLVLNERVDRPLAQPLASFFSIQPGIPLQQVKFTSDTTLQLTYQQSFESNSTYQLEVSGLPDCWGNKTSQPAQLSFTYISPYGAQPRGIVINEFFPDPTPSQGLPKFEYTELYNRSNRPFSLQGWTYADRNSQAQLPDTVINAGEVILLLPLEADTAYADTVNKLPLADWPTLNNGGDVLKLKSADGDTIDSLSYDDTWYDNPAKANGGWALAQINPDHPCSGPDNWKGSSDSSGGTPGHQNAVLDPSPDTTSPSVREVTVQDSLTLKVTFSERVAVASLQVSQWELKPGVGIQNLNTRSSKLAREATVTLQQALSNQTSYTLSYSGLEDCWGNQQRETDQQSFTYLKPEPAFYQDLLVTEIMRAPEPTVGLPPYEYIELRNNSDKVIALQDQRLLVDSQPVELPEKLLKPDTSLILTDPLGAAAFLEEGQVIGVSGLPPLINAGGRLTLRNQDGALLHTVAYKDDWYGGSFKEEGGWSLEMIDTDQACLGKQNWQPSEAQQGGTPGRPNSVKAQNPITAPPALQEVRVMDSVTIRLSFSKRMDSLSLINGAYQITPALTVDNIRPRTPLFRSVELQFNQPANKSQIYRLQVENVKDCIGNELPTSERKWGLPQKPGLGDILINEILFNPSGNGADYVELVNTTDQVLSLDRLRLGDRGERDQIDDQEGLPSGQLLPGQYLALTEMPEAVSANFDVKNARQLWAMDALPTYSNDKGTVVLFRKDGRVIDEVSYSEDWHTQLIDDPSGVSLERISLQQPSNDADNWQSAAETAGFGTPTYENSQAGKLGEKEGAFSLSSNVFSPDQDGYRDFLRIQYDLPKDGFLATITIYDTKGRPVRQLTNNALLGREGSLKWDGTRDNGQSVAEGVYILQGKIFHPDGDKRSFQKSVTVGKR
jgi:hypothetical protein